MAKRPRTDPGRSEVLASWGAPQHLAGDDFAELVDSISFAFLSRHDRPAAKLPADRSRTADGGLFKRDDARQRWVPASTDPLLHVRQAVHAGTPPEHRRGGYQLSESQKRTLRIMLDKGLQLGDFRERQLRALSALARACEPLTARLRNGPTEQGGGARGGARDGTENGRVARARHHRQGLGLLFLGALRGGGGHPDAQDGHGRERDRRSMAASRSGHETPDFRGPGGWNPLIREGFPIGTKYFQDKILVRVRYTYFARKSCFQIYWKRKYVFRAPREIRGGFPKFGPYKQSCSTLGTPRAGTGEGVRAVEEDAAHRARPPCLRTARVFARGIREQGLGGRERPRSERRDAFASGATARSWLR